MMSEQLLQPCHELIRRGEVHLPCLSIMNLPEKELQFWVRKTEAGIRGV